MDIIQENLPAWDNSTEYTGLNSADFNQDVALFHSIIGEMQKINLTLEELFKLTRTAEEEKQMLQLLQDLAAKKEQALDLLANLSTFVNCELSINVKNEEASKLESQIRTYWSQFSSVNIPSDLFLTKCSDEILQNYLQSPETKTSEFYWRNKRKMKPYLLSEQEEKILAETYPFACDGWGNLYNQVSGNLKVKTPNLGEKSISQVAGVLRGPDENLRKEAWIGIQEAWKTVEVPCAAILNNLAGYRLELVKKRSSQKSNHFLNEPLFQAKIEKETLDMMMKVVHENIEIPRRVLRAMAKSLNKKQMDPWDILAPSPRVSLGTKYSFNDALSMIRDAFHSVSPAMGDFVDMMYKNKWIDARVLETKRSGAYCTGFLKSATPRVFQSYSGSMKDISTLAHELGHAYHSWVMRDLKVIESHYPLTVAETASTFAETLLSQRLFNSANGDEQFSIAWEEVSDVASMMINIPARFEFEKSFYEARQKGALSAQELNQLTDQAWRKWYGPEISKTEEQYWMTKLHFSISGISFYNFPYTFGYLFSLGIYAQFEKHGEQFHQRYVELLQDSGRMTVEDLILKHLKSDIREPQFWQESINIIEKKVSNFEKLA